MTPLASPEARLALAPFRDATLATRAHVTIRWLTCPFPAVEAAVPRTGRVLDYGCGHGLLSLYLAARSPARRVTGVDLDPRKLRAARRAAARADVTFAQAESGTVPPGPWDAIVVVDVLYLLSLDEQERLLHTQARTLAPGGRLVVKELAHHPWLKFRWATAQEQLSVNVLGITRGQTLAYASPTQLAGWMQTGGLTVRERALHRGYPHPHHLLVGSAPPTR